MSELCISNAGFNCLINSTYLKSKNGTLTSKPWAAIVLSVRKLSNIYSSSSSLMVSQWKSFAFGASRKYLYEPWISSDPSPLSKTLISVLFWIYSAMIYCGVDALIVVISYDSMALMTLGISLMPVETLNGMI